jgi:hypothetical protein
MQNKVFDFESFINEASLEGNRGIPGEAGDTASSWLKKIDTEKGGRMAEFERENRQDIMRFMQFVGQSQQIQRGHETELSQLAEDAFRTLFSSLLDDVTLDFKLGNEAAQTIEETPSENSNIEMKIEDIDDERILSEIERRKILRSIQQGKGLTSKAILNLPMFKKGISDILGDRADEYIQLLNKISGIAQFNDWRLSEEMIKMMLRGGTAGACKIEFDEKEDYSSEYKVEDKEQSAEDLLKDIMNGDDLEDSEAAADLIEGTGARIIARGVDMSVLIHEAIKGIYMLPLQLSLEHLSEEEAELVIANTDTLLDEAQEFKYGPEMQKSFYKAISNNPEVKERLDNFKRNLDDSDAWDEMGAFEEKLFWMVFGLLATIHQEDATEMLKIVYAVLIEDQKNIEELFYPIVEDAIKNLEAEEEYQSSKSKQAEPSYSEPMNREEEPKISLASKKEDLSPDEVNDAIIDAYERRDMAEVARLRKEYLGESTLLPYSVWIKLNS